MTAPQPVLYLGDVLASFGNGCQLDLRVRLAIQFMTGGGITDPITALDSATQLLDLATKRGLLKPMPEDDGLSKPMRTHIRRGVRVQIAQQVCQQEIVQDEAPKLAVPPGGNSVLPFSKQ